MTELENFILENCFSSRGGLINHISNDTWWANKQAERHKEDILLYPGSTIPEKIYNIFNKRPLCKICNSNTLFYSFTRGYATYCSLACSYKDSDRSNKIVKNTDQKAKGETYKQTIKKRYPTAKAYKEFHEQQVIKTKQTKLERYGNANYNNVEKQSQTVQDRYGVRFSSLIPSKIEKTIHRAAEKYPTVRNKTQLEDLNQFLTQEQISQELGVSPSLISRWFKIHGISTKRHRITKGHLTLIQILEKHNIPFVVNDRSQIAPYEIDIFIPSHNIGIEFNGLFWHKNNKTKHIDKLNRCNSVGIDLIQFWDFEIRDKLEICESIILSRLGKSKDKIYARSCTIRDLSNVEYKNFCVANHIQGYCSARIKLGLFYKDQLVFVASFSKSRYRRDFDWELIRSVSLLNTQVVGGFSKLLAFFSKAYSGSIITYTDLRIFNSKSLCKYEALYTTKPNYFYYTPINEQIKSRHNFQKKQVLKLYPNEKGTEQEILARYDWYPVYDCGSLVTKLR